MKKPIIPIKHATPAILAPSALSHVRGGGGKPIIRNGDEPVTDGDGTIRNKGTT